MSADASWRRRLVVEPNGCMFVIVIAMIITIAACKMRTVTLTPQGNKTIQVFDRKDVKRYRARTRAGIPDTLRPVKIILIPKNNPNEKFRNHTP